MVSSRVRDAVRTVSPGKTVTGMAGGLLGGVATSLVIGLPAMRHSRWLPLMPLWRLETYIFFGLSISAAAITGDVMESLLKRCAGVEDSGTLFPGHGGCLDRMDSFLLAGPLFLSFVLMLHP